jgi:hypothetical protein
LSNKKTGGKIMLVGSSNPSDREIIEQNCNIQRLQLQVIELQNIIKAMNPSVKISTDKKEIEIPQGKVLEFGSNGFRMVDLLEEIR